MDQWATVVEDFDATPNTTVNEASIIITGGRARVGAINTNRSIYRTNGDLWTDAYFELEIVTFTGTIAAGGYMRYDTGTAAGYSINIDASQAYVDNILVGNISTVSYTLGGLPGILRGEVQGDSVRVYWKGQLITSVRDTGVTTPGRSVLYMWSAVAANNEVNRWETGPLGPQYHAPCRQISRGSLVAGMR